MSFRNTFALYTGDKHDRLSRECTSRIKKAWKDFVKEVRSIRSEYENQGATDTASREEMCDWVKDKSTELI